MFHRFGCMDLHADLENCLKSKKDCAGCPKEGYYYALTIQPDRDAVDGLFDIGINFDHEDDFISAMLQKIEKHIDNVKGLKLCTFDKCTTVQFLKQYYILMRSFMSDVTDKENDALYRSLLGEAVYESNAGSKAVVKFGLGFWYDDLRSILSFEVLEV